jgi:hypothetical protein
LEERRVQGAKQVDMKMVVFTAKCFVTVELDPCKVAPLPSKARAKAPRNHLQMPIAEVCTWREEELPPVTSILGVGMDHCSIERSST